MDILHRDNKDKGYQKEIKKRRFIATNSIIYISLIVLILIVSLLICLFFIDFHSDVIQDYISSKALFVARMLSIDVAAQHILKKDFEHLKEHLKNVTSDKDIIYAAVLTPDGEKIVESDEYLEVIPNAIDLNSIPPKDALVLELKNQEGKKIGYEVYKKILSDNKQIGLSRIIISFNDIKKALSYKRNNLITLLTLIALVEGIICFVLMHLINKPMIDIVKATEKIAKGDFNIFIQNRSRTEIGLLAQSINEITKEIRQYRDKIISQSNELKAIIDSMGSGLFTVDKDWKIKIFNKSAERITGHMKDNVIGKTCQEVFQSDVCQDKCPIERSLSEDKSIISDDFNIKTIDGRRIPISASTSPLKDEAGEIIGGVEVFKDLTEIKELQKQLFQADKMSALGQMISGITHDINNPTGVIYSNMISLSEYTEIIKGLLTKYRKMAQRLINTKTPEILSDLSEILKFEKHNDIDYILEDLDCLVEENKEASSRLTKIIKGLRNFIHIDIGELRLADINQRLDMALDLIKFDKNIKIVKGYSYIPFIHCNVQQIDQVFTNIILNALQELGSKGEIRIRTAYEQNKVLIAIWDNGPGIPEDILPKIFDPFFTTKGIGTGTGLGLSISYTIITKHGGEIWAKSEFGKWTEFFIRLPLKPPEFNSHIWRKS